MSKDYDEISTPDGTVKIIIPETGEEWEGLPRALPRNIVASGLGEADLDLINWDHGDVMLEGGPITPDDGNLWDLGSPTRLLGEGFNKIYCTQANQFKSFLLEYKAFGKESISIDLALEEFDKMFGTTLDGEI